MALAQNIVSAMESVNVLPKAGGDIACAMAPFGCTGSLSKDRVIVVLQDGTQLGTCADWVRHTTIVKTAGTGSEAQQFFNWLLGIYRVQNPDRQRGDKSPLHALDLRKARARGRVTA